MELSASRNRVIDALEEVWASIGRLLDALDGPDWRRSSPLPGWSVHDVVTHMIGTESMLLGQPTPAIDIDRSRSPHVRRDNDLDNERWVESLRSTRPNVVRELFGRRTGQRPAALRTMTDEDWRTASFGPVGQFSYEEVMHIRVYDCWIHEQDIRDGTGRPGNEVGLAVDVTLDVVAAAIGPAVAADLRGSGRTVSFVLTSGPEIVRTMHLHLGDPARVVRSPRDTWAATLTMPVGVMTRLSAGRVESDSVMERIRIDGDRGLAERMLSTNSPRS